MMVEQPQCTNRGWFFLLAVFGMFCVLVNCLMPYVAAFGGTAVSTDWTVITAANAFYKEAVAAIIGGLLALEHGGRPYVQPPPGTVTTTSGATTQTIETPPIVEVAPPRGPETH